MAVTLNPCIVREGDTKIFKCSALAVHLYQEVYNFREKPFHILKTDSARKKKLEAQLLDPATRPEKIRIFATGNNWAEFIEKFGCPFAEFDISTVKKFKKNIPGINLFSFLRMNLEKTALNQVQCISVSSIRPIS